MSGHPPDPWRFLADRTQARIALGRAGASLPTAALLTFDLAHAQARDAVHSALDVESMKAGLERCGLPAVEVESEAADRQRYLRRPDDGRRLSAPSRTLLSGCARAPCDLALAIGDGLSAQAANHHAVAVVAAVLPLLQRRGLVIGPVVVARGARVALGDEIGALLRARTIAVLIGERPGLSASDSLGIYLTYDPKPGRKDSERNCISNVRAAGLSPADAARQLAWLVEAALARRLSGVLLKDESGQVQHTRLRPPE